jgi:hypothetical protein
VSKKDEGRKSGSGDGKARGKRGAKDPSAAEVTERTEKLGRKDYEAQLARLQADLVTPQSLSRSSRFASSSRGATAPARAAPSRR